MLSAIFLKLTDLAFFRRLLWKPVYELLARQFRVREWAFMNYGYVPLGNEPMLDLEPNDEINRYPIQLYHYLASKVAIRSKQVLEVGSGRGGGASYINRYLQPGSITGLDIAAIAVQLANENYEAGRIRFVQGSAEQLPFESESFDVVINVESSHTYGSVSRFLMEVARVLRPGGYLLLADLRVKKDMVRLRQQLAASPLKVLEEEDISPNVALAMEAEEPIKNKRIETHVPPAFQPLFRQFSGVVGSKAHKALQSGELLYHRFLLQKS